MRTLSGFRDKAFLLIGAIGMMLGMTSAAPAQWNNKPIDPKLPTLWLIGDSTVRNGRNDDGGNGQWGWGNPIASYLDQSKLNVQNRAMGGTSSRTYQNDGLWEKVVSEMKPGDYLIMQFGHNDSGKPDDPARARASIPGNSDKTVEIDNPITKKHEIVHTYGWYLREFVKQAQAKGVKEVIICSPIPRNSWKDGKVGRNTNYTTAAAEAAKQAGVAFIDLNELTAKKYDAEGEAKVTEKYFPEKEVVHTDWAGAVLNAESVIEGIKMLEKSDLVQYILPNPPKDLKHPSGKPR